VSFPTGSFTLNSSASSVPVVISSKFCPPPPFFSLLV
jgi:hypothetical protein